MIVASPKPITELKNLIARHGKVLFVGCGTCVTVCLAGGEREVGIASYAVRMARKIEGKPLELTQVTIERQCENEFIKDLAEPAAKADAIVSFGCGAGVQAIAERFPNKPVYAGLNTQFLGILEEQAVWTEKCLGCGDCMLAQFGGICPVTRCAKRMLNGPCGGSTEKRCEVDDGPPLRLAAHLHPPQEHRPARPPGGHRSAQGLAPRLARRRPQDRAPRAPGLGDSHHVSGFSGRIPLRRWTKPGNTRAVPTFPARPSVRRVLQRVGPKHDAQA